MLAAAIFTGRADIDTELAARSIIVLAEEYAKRAFLGGRS